MPERERERVLRERDPDHGGFEVHCISPSTRDTHLSRTILELEQGEGTLQRVREKSEGVSLLFFPIPIGKC